MKTYLLKKEKNLKLTPEQLDILSFKKKGIA